MERGQRQLPAGKEMQARTVAWVHEEALGFCHLCDLIDPKLRPSSLGLKILKSPEVPLEGAGRRLESGVQGPLLPNLPPPVHVYLMF